MQELEQYAQQLKTHDNLCFHVLDWIFNKPYPNAQKITQKFLDANYSGDISQYIQTFKKMGLPGVQILPRIKNGSGTKPDENNAIIKIEFKDTAATPQIAVPAAEKNRDMKSTVDVGLGIYAEGVSAQNELAQLKSRYAEIKTERDSYKTSSEQFKDKYVKLDTDATIKASEMKKLKKKIKKLKKSSGGLNGVMENPATMLIIEKFASKFLGDGGPQVPQDPAALYGANPDFTEIKNQFIKNVTGFPDKVLAELNKILIAYSTNDTETINQFKQLIAVPEPITTETDA